MAFYTKIDPAKCRAFSLSLKGEALEWYYTLPPNSIDCFDIVITLFRSQYFVNRKEDVTAVELVNIRQGKGETLRAFMQRYNEVARCVKDVNHTFIISNLPNCLKLGYVAENLYAKPPKRMEELQEKMIKYIRKEDLRNYRKKQLSDAPASGNKKEARQPHEGDHDHKPSRRELPLPLGLRYDQYANLNVPMATVLTVLCMLSLTFSKLQSFLEKKYKKKITQQESNIKFFITKVHQRTKTM